jgi:hypothetical protein
MSNQDPAERDGIVVDRIMVHDLVNHLTIALGNCDLMLMDADAGGPHVPMATEIRKACQRAVDLVQGWRENSVRRP